MNVQKHADKPVSSTSASAKYYKNNERNYVYTPGSLWSHLKYGLGTLAVIAIPPLLPGVTDRILIMGYLGTLITVLGGACVLGMLRSLHPPGRRR